MRAYVRQRTDFARRSAEHGLTTETVEGLGHDLESIVGTPLLVGNKVALLQDGPATFRAMFDAIRNARDHINLETYLIEDDEVRRQFAAELVLKQAEGVQINIIYDSVGAIGAQMEAMFEADLAASDRITLEDWQQRSLDHRVKELAARIWEYWL